MQVTRCICLDVSFEALKRFADDLARRGVAVDAARLAEMTRAGSACGMCTPYIEEMLKTGATAFALKRNPSTCTISLTRS